MNSNNPKHEKTLLQASDIKLISLQAGIETGYPIVEEVSNNLLVYTHPFFKAQATVKVPPLARGSGIQVGWIQVITKGVDIMKYSNNEFVSCEIPEIVKGDEHMVNDSMGEMLPWYNARNATKYIIGQTLVPSFVTVSLTDRPESNISLSLYKNGESTKPNLNFAYQKNRFYSYLVFKNVHDDNYNIIKALTWVAEVAIGFNPNKPLGERVEFIGPCEFQEPLHMSDWFTPPLEKFALQRPTANHGHMFIVRSKRKQSLILKNPSETTVNLNTYVSDTEDYTDVLSNITLKNFLKRYL